MIVAPLVAGWHLPTFFLEEGGWQPFVVVGGFVTTMAVTIWYNWLFNRTGGSVLLVIVAHNLEGSIQYEFGWIYMCLWCAVAIGLVVLTGRLGAAQRQRPRPCNRRMRVRAE